MKWLLLIIFASFATSRAQLAPRIPLPLVSSKTVAAGGGGGGSCPSSPTMSQSALANSGAIADGTTQFRGQRFMTNTTSTLCRLDVRMNLNAGDISAKHFEARVYNTNGCDLGTLVGTSTAILGTNWTGNTSIPFYFSTPVTLTGNTWYVAVVTTQEAGDAANNARIYFQDTDAFIGWFAGYNAAGVNNSGCSEPNEDMTADWYFQ